MKKTILKAEYILKIFNDGSGGYGWTHPWKISKRLSSKDMILHPIWDDSDLSEDTETSHIQNYTKTLGLKSKVDEDFDEVNNEID